MLRLKERRGGRSPSGLAGRVVVAAALPPPVHGQSVVTADIVSQLDSAGATPLVMDLSPGSLHRSAAYHARRIRRVAIALGRMIGLRQSRPAHLYTVVESGLGLGYNFAILAVARLRRFRIVAHHHTATHLRRRKPLVGYLFALAGPRAAHVVLSEQMGQDLRRLYPEVGRVLIAHNARYVPQPDASGHESSKVPMKVGMLSNLSWDKGVDLAIDAIRQVRSAGLAIELILAGPMHDQVAEDAIRSARDSLGHALDYRGPVYGSDKSRFFADIDVLLFPTRYRNEAQPLVILEAMAHGIPCIAYDRGYIKELVGDSGAVVAVDDDFVTATFTILTGWTATPETFQALQDLCLARFGLLRETSRNQFGNLLLELLKRPTGAAMSSSTPTGYSLRKNGGHN